MAIPKKAYLLSFFSRHYHKKMELKCKARRYLSLFSYKGVNHMTNYVNFKLSKNVEKYPGPTQYNTDHHEVIIRPFIQNYSSTMQLTSPISSENLMQSRLGELGLQSIDVGSAGDCLFRSVSHQLYEHACLFYEKCNVDSVGKMPSNITVYDAEIKIKYSHLNQGSLTQCYL